MDKRYSLLLCLSLLVKGLQAQINPGEAAAHRADTVYKNSTDSLDQLFLQCALTPRFVARVIYEGKSKRAEWYCDTIYNGNQDTLIRLLISYEIKKEMTVIKRDGNELMVKRTFECTERYLLSNGALICFWLDETLYGAYDMGIKMEPTPLGFLSYYYKDGKAVYNQSHMLSGHTGSELNRLNESEALALFLKRKTRFRKRDR